MLYNELLFESKDDVYRFILENKLVDITDNILTINLSEFVREDRTANLELLELSIELASAKFIKEVVLNFDGYFECRNIEYREEEIKFYYGFITSVVSEFFEENVQIL